MTSQELQDGLQLPLAHDGGLEQHRNDLFSNFFSGPDDSWFRDTLVAFFRFSYHFQTYGDHTECPTVTAPTLIWNIFRKF